MFLTGGLLLITQATKAYGNPFFRAKLQRQERFRLRARLVAG